MTLEHIAAQERELQDARTVHHKRLVIIRNQLLRLERRRHQILQHPNWERTAEVAALKRETRMVRHTAGMGTV